MFRWNWRYSLSKQNQDYVTNDSLNACVFFYLFFDAEDFFFIQLDPFKVVIGDYFAQNSVNKHPGVTMFVFSDKVIAK